MPCRVSVIIPTRNGERWLRRSLPLLRSQTLPDVEILLVDSRSTDATPALAHQHGCRLHTIDPNHFSHGGTRNLAASLAGGDTLVFMTQDVLPASPSFIERLIHPIERGDAAAAYARQRPNADASPLETFARHFNYPPESHTRTLADVQTLGGKAFFFSNAASAVARHAFEHVGGFPTDQLTNEDMALCARLLHAGYAVRYEASAQVHHSHAHTIGALFRRYFDMGVVGPQLQRHAPGATLGGAGGRFASALARHLVTSGQWRLLPRALAETFVKASAYALGKHHAWLPRCLRPHLSSHPSGWHRPHTPREPSGETT